MYAVADQKVTIDEIEAMHCYPSMLNWSLLTGELAVALECDEAEEIYAPIIFDAVPTGGDTQKHDA